MGPFAGVTPLPNPCRVRKVPQMKLVTCGAAQQIRPPLKAADHADINGVGLGDLGQGLARGTPLERKTPKFHKLPDLGPSRWTLGTVRRPRPLGIYGQANQ